MNERNLCIDIFETIGLAVPDISSTKWNWSEIRLRDFGWYFKFVYNLLHMQHYRLFLNFFANGKMMVILNLNAFITRFGWWKSIVFMVELQPTALLACIWSWLAKFFVLLEKIFYFYDCERSTTSLSSWIRCGKIKFKNIHEG